MKLPTKIPDFEVNGRTYTHEDWENNPAETLSGLAADLVGMVTLPVVPFYSEELPAGTIYQVNGELRISDAPAVTGLPTDEKREPLWPARRVSVQVGPGWLLPPIDGREKPEVRGEVTGIAPIRKHAPFPAQALRSEPGVAPFLEFDN